MSDQHTALLVVLKQPLHEAQTKGIADAIARLQGVAWVEPVIGDVSAEIAAFYRTKQRLADAFWEAFQNVTHDV